MTENGFVGSLGAFWECYDMSTNIMYPVTSYNTQDDNSDLDIQSKVYCTEYTVTCVPEIGNIFIIQSNRNILLLVDSLQH